jgi:hypothetical protein
MSFPPNTIVAPATPGRWTDLGFPWANYTAAPVFAMVARRLFDYYNIPPDEIRLAKAGATVPVATGD